MGMMLKQVANYGQIGGGVKAVSANRENAAGKK
jgi:hypothetical protein